MKYNRTRFFEQIKHLVFFLALLLCIYVQPANAQTALPQNLSSIKVDQLSDEQLRNFRDQIGANGLSDSQLEQLALSRGMSAEEIAKLKFRVVNLGDRKETSPKNNTSSRAILVPVDSSRNAIKENKSKIFGADLFSTANLSFEPNLRLATPANYILGPDDEIRLEITGYNEASYKLTISPEGSIRVQYAGLITVSGLTVEQAAQRIKSRLIKYYPAIASGGTQITLGVGNIRSIKVTVLGEANKPGSYSLPSLASAFNALYVAGGPSKNGSLRQIEIIRNNKIVRKLDVYDFLNRGDQQNNIRLQDQDIIRIPPYQQRVELSGEVKRPAIFEMLKGENLQQLIDFAGGFTENAYTSRIKVLQNTSKERKISDVAAADFKTYLPRLGDQFFVEPILDRFENRVFIKGAVFRPGEYALSQSLTLSKLIQKAEGLKEDAFMSRGFITRLKSDNTSELISFDLSKIIKGAVADIPLSREDVVNISSIFDLKEEYVVSIDGEVIKPGKFAYAENMSLEDLIIKAGGFKESATTQRIEISRRVINNDYDAASASAKTAEIFQLNVNRNLSLEAAKFILKPYDLITVRAAPGYEVQKQVTIQGEVLYPGVYTISNKKERISDLVNRAGGLTQLAFEHGASLKRMGKIENAVDLEKEEIKLQQFKKVQSEIQDSLSSELQNLTARNNFIGINLQTILNRPGSKKDLFLEEGDVISIPKQLQTIKVSGEVLSPNNVVYQKGKSFKNYIKNAGGFSQKSLRSKSYVIYANGTIKSTSKFLCFNNYPAIKSGSELFVPRVEDKRKLSPAETVGIFSGIASLGAVILGVMTLLK